MPLGCDLVRNQLENTFDVDLRDGFSSPIGGGRPPLLRYGRMTNNREPESSA
jgi:hypothetical protein